jgi:TRAP-type transport system periplasmic protein
MSWRHGGTLAVALLAAGATAHAETVTLRLASAVPEGTAWARELKAFSREVTASTHEQVQVKWYLGGIAGDELQAHERVQRDQLDGVVSGGMLCQKLAPSMRAASMASEFHDRDEVAYVMSRLKPIVDGELEKAGYVVVATAGMGFTFFFTRTPVRSMADLKRLRTWIWSLDDVLVRQLGAAGVNLVPLSVEGAGRAYDHDEVDGFLALPTAAVAFQWSTQARYVLDLRVGYLTGCFLVARRAWDTLPHDQQQAVLNAAGKLQKRVEDIAQQSDQMLLGGLFAKQGLQALAASPALQSEFAEATQKAQQQVAKLAPPGMLERVAGLIAEYRSRRGAK